MQTDEQQLLPPQLKTKRSTVPLLAVVFGAVACVLNGLFLTLALGLLCGLTALGFGLISWLKHGKSGGLILTALSFFILVVWVCTVVIPVLVDPTLTFE